MKSCLPFFFAAAIVTSVFAQDPAPKPAAPESRPAEAKDRRMGQASPVVITKDREVYGAELSLKEPTKLADIIKDPKAYEGRKLRVNGAIDSVCQKKGCWMILKDGDAEAQVKFHDYSFFVPLDVAGRPVAVEGMAKVTVLTEKWLRHRAEDAGKSKEEIAKIKGDQTSVAFVVEAVEIGPAAPSQPPKASESKPADKKAG